MNIRLRTWKVPLKLKLLAAKPDNMLYKNYIFQPLPFITSSTKSFRKFEFEANAFSIISRLSSFSGAQVHGGNLYEKKERGHTVHETSLCRAQKFTTQSKDDSISISRYRNLLSKKVSAAFKLYRAFNVGIINFYNDLKLFLKIHRSIRKSPDNLKMLNLKELNLYMQMPKELLKIIPIMILAWIPIIGYAVCALIFLYPRLFLTSHFWSPHQYDEFLRKKLQKRHTNSKLIIRSLQKQLQGVKEPLEYCNLANRLAMLGYGCASPTTDELIKLRELFTKPPLNLHSLEYDHIKLLTLMHGLRHRLFKRSKLKNHANLIHLMDHAIERDGGVEELSLETLKKACALRGLNPLNLSKKDLERWLKNWTAITMTMQEQHFDFLLHLPLFLAYNHPNNWRLCIKQKVCT